MALRSDSDGSEATPKPRRKKQPEAPRRIQVVDRVGRLLAAFTVEEPELTLTDCAKAASMNKSSVYRLLTSLEHVGFVERNDLLWRLGPTTVNLAAIRLGHLDIRKEALPYLRQLRREFRCAVAFGVPEATDMIFLERLDSPDDAYGVTVRLPIRTPAWTGASGKALIAKLEPEKRAPWLESEEFRRLPRHLRDSITTEIEHAAVRGYSIDTGEFFNGLAALGVALIGTSGEPVAGMSVVLPRERMTPEYEQRMAQRLQEFSARVEQSFGFNVNS